MKKLRILAVAVLVLALAVCVLASCGTEDHVHEFADATCTAPKSCSCGATEGEALGHTYESVVTAPTCEADGYTTYTCHCGYTYTGDTVAAPGHDYEAVVTEPTCLENGFTTYTCACGYSYIGTTVITEGHEYEAVVTEPTCTANGYTTYTCHCGDSYVADEVVTEGHSYEAVVTAPTCSATGYTTYTCHCGNSYVADETPVAEHIDTNLDITCDYEGCTKRILPAQDSEVSLFTANHMIIMSLSNNYYVQGVVTEVVDAKNGIFVIRDGEGYDLLVRLPKDADGTSYSSWTTKVTLGDTIKVYGKPTQNTSATNPQKAKIEGGVLTVLKHEHSFSEPTCINPAKCDCLVLGADALGHIDENSDGACDRCEWNMNAALTYIAVRTDADGNGVLDDAKTKWQWSDENFTVEISKGASTYTLYTTAKAYMQLKKQNDFTIYNTNGAKINTVTIYTTNSTQLNNLKAAAAGLTFTVNEADLSITIDVNAEGDFTFQNAGTQTVYVSGVQIAYEPAKAE